MTTNRSSNTHCYECGKSFTAAEWLDRHDVHPDWCVASEGEACECDPAAERFAVHSRCCYACSLSQVESNRRRRGHRFYPRHVELMTVPALYATERQRLQDRTVALHYFMGSCDWWVVEYDPADRLAFGYACLGDSQCAEWGYVGLAELEALLVRGFPVERDLYWVPRPAKDCSLPGSAF